MYEKRSGEAFPEKYKVAALVQIMPKMQAAEFKWRFVNGLSNYSSLVEQIEQYSQHIRHETAYGRGEGDDRMVDALAHEDWLSKPSGAEVVAFYEGVHAGTNSEHKEMPDMNPDDQPLDLMYKKGKGKGKGKRGPPQGGKGDQGRYSRDTSAHAGTGQGAKPVC